ncbi:MAG TPA: YdcF family protein [Planctomycetota bacterium]|nr:YdcF family protein [Planctomycetota bacterium]
MAAHLWYAGKAKVLVASGSSIGDMEVERNLAAETAALWRGLGVAPEAIVQIPAGRVNTTQEIAAYAALIHERGWTRVGLISSAWHLPRALRLCRAQHLDLIPIGADLRGRFRSWSPIWLIPQNHGFDRIQHACWEYLGMLTGR